MKEIQRSMTHLRPLYNAENVEIDPHVAAEILRESDLAVTQAHNDLVRDVQRARDRLDEIERDLQRVVEAKLNPMHTGFRTSGYLGSTASAIDEAAQRLHMAGTYRAQLYRAMNIDLPEVTF